MTVTQATIIERPEGQLGSWLLVVSVVGYAPVGLAASVLNLPRELTSIPFRGFVLLLALMLIFRLRHRELPRGIGLLIVFWIAYLLRLLWDWNGGQPKMEEAVVFFVGTVFIPGLAVALLSAESIDWRLTATRMLWLGAAFCTAAVASFHLGLGRESEAILMAGRLEFDTVNTITIGHTAVSTVIAALCLSSDRERKARKAWLLIVCIPALVALVLAGARGPAVSLAVCVTALLIVTRHWRLLFFALLAGLVFIAQPENELARRFMALLEPTLEDESSLERITLISNAFQQFVESPLLGGQLLDRVYFSYPHNLFLEALMAMGVVGALALIAILTRSALRATHLINQGNLFIPLVLLQYFIAAQFSGAIWGWSAMWVPLASIISCGPTARHVSSKATRGGSASSC